MTTMKITETDGATHIEGDGVEVMREGTEWCIDTNGSRIFLDQILAPFDGKAVNLRLSIEIPGVKKPDAKK